MATKQKKPALGRGLDAILIDNDEQKEQNGVSVVRISEVEPNPDQPRKSFENEPLEALAVLSSRSLYAPAMECI